MIVDEPLPFPEGKAAAEVLKAGENPGPGLKILGISAALGGLIKGRGGERHEDPRHRRRRWLLRQVPGYMGTNLSPAPCSASAGIVGLNIGIVVVSGSILSWHIAIPLYHACSSSTPTRRWRRTSPARVPRTSPARSGRPRSATGVGAMLIGGAWIAVLAAQLAAVGRTAVSAARGDPMRTSPRPSATCR